MVHILEVSCNKNDELAGHLKKKDTHEKLVDNCQHVW